MKAREFFGRILWGNIEAGRKALGKWLDQPVDFEDLTGPYPAPRNGRTTINSAARVSGPGTFFRRALRHLSFEPSRCGWWFDRADLPDCLPTEVSVRNVWTTGRIVSNIVLRSGPPHNYVRMVEHIVALKVGLGIDDLNVLTDSGDPPLFAEGSRRLVDAVTSAGIRRLSELPRYVTVKEKVSVISPSGAFLVFEPWQGCDPFLTVDCAIHFENAIGRQRVRFALSRALFERAAVARTNTTAAKKLYCQTIGRIFADIRNLGYTHENILVVGRRRYVNQPRLPHGDKYLEPVWHRAALDLLAAVALVDRGRFVGAITSYKAGHALDVRMITRLYRHELLADVTARILGSGT
ncbi:MAG TPA: hypothetical protein EYP62_01080 [Kiritimatiellae bacterium]|nr:hypothetical protein [Kiritimatiellia bacterium]